MLHVQNYSRICRDFLFPGLQDYFFKTKEGFSFLFFKSTCEDMICDNLGHCSMKLSQFRHKLYWGVKGIKLEGISFLYLLPKSWG